MADRRRRARDWRLAGLPKAIGTPEHVESEERTMQRTPGPVPMKAVVKKILSGIAKAQRDYEDWSGGSWLWKAPEYMLTTYIAKELGTMPGSKYLTLESNVRRTLEGAGGMGRGKISDAARLGGRSDIVLRWGSDKMPRAVIEVKNQVSDSATEIKQDIKRISAMLRKRDNSFQCGLVAFYTSRWDRKGDGEGARSTIKDRLESIESETRNILGERCRLSRHDSIIRVDGDSAWVASVLQIQRAP